MLNWLCKFLDTNIRNKAVFFIIYFHSVLLVCAQAQAVFPFAIMAEY